ncbi:MAG: glycosyltransferase [Gemmatimonadetes bacterium]|nr:glycosyltransferase [Gemmatimonadota bacterium]
MSLRILLLSQYYDPEPFKGDALGGGLVRRGHRVTAVTGFPNYPLGRTYEGYRQRPWQWERRRGVRVLRLPMYPDHTRSAVRRALTYGTFAASASTLGPALCGPQDVMWVYHPPLTVAGPALAISRLRRVPFVLEIQDLWPETLAATGMVGSPRLLGAVGRAAMALYRRASALVVISEGFKRNLAAKGVPADKVHVIPNWADEEVYRPVAPDPALARRWGLEGRFNVMFGGNLGPAQGLGTVLDAADRLRGLPDVQLVLVGEGVDREGLERSAAERGLTNVRFLPRQPPEAMPALYALADALLLHLRRDPLFEITIPSKTLAYLACGRPVLCAVPGDAAEAVLGAGAGVACPSEDPAALAEAVRTLHAMPSLRREAMGAAGRAAYLALYSQEGAIGRYEALLARVARRGKA